MSKPTRAPPTRFVIVPDRPAPSRLRRWMWPLAWLGSIGAACAGTVQLTVANLPALVAEMDANARELQQARDANRHLRQREAVLERSDQISRVANQEMQGALAERDDQIAALRADVAFYERLVGATEPRKGLAVHSAAFSREPGGSWRYRIVLTQTRDRNAVSHGQLKFALEGVQGGQLARVGWDRLHQAESAPAQGYSFRYFQQLRGSVMLPEGFTPQRVRVYLRGDGAAHEQTLPWGAAG
ncbi:DUF6776 family protein [Lysobacter sp. A3-1-A15]|uniref:DUF6776 family protein n=1 Tax=Novilysobacter viscosus TaxID=3098602 RepID=UPI002ED9AB28